MEKKTYEKVEKANEYRELLRNVIKPYLTESKSNSGQLKFIDGTLVRVLAVSTRYRVKKESFEKFFDNNIIPKAKGGNDQTISYFSQEDNLEAYFNSPYSDECIYHEPLKNTERIMPFLLLQRIQNVMEEKLLAYLNTKDENETVDGDEYKMQSDKNKAYVELLYSLAIYEIFLIDFMEDGIEPHMTNSGRVLKEEILDLYKKLEVSREPEQTEQIILKLQKTVSEYRKFSDEVLVTGKYMSLFMRHYTNLQAILRIIMIIEYVHINQAALKNKEKDVRNSRLINNWFVENCGEYGQGFFSYPNSNKNLSKYYKNINTIFNKYKILDVKHLEEMNEVNNLIVEYLKIIESNEAGKRSEREEKRLWKIQDELSIYWSIEIEDNE